MGTIATVDTPSSAADKQSPGSALRFRNQKSMNYGQMRMDRRTSLFGDEVIDKGSESGESRASKKSSMSRVSKLSKLSPSLKKSSKFAATLSVKSASKRSTKKLKKEKLPQPEKLDLPERKLHKDNLTEQHFLDARNFLARKKR